MKFFKETLDENVRNEETKRLENEQRMADDLFLAYVDSVLSGEIN